MKTNFPSFQSLKGNGWPQAVTRIREQAFEFFHNAPFPTTHVEDWRFTNVAPYLKIPFRSATDTTAPVPALKQQNASQIVFINGRYSEKLSRLPAEIRVGSVAHPPEGMDWESFAGRIVPAGKNAFVAWNTAFFEDIALVYVPDGTVLSEPVRISFFYTGEPDVIVFPRTLVVLGKQSQVSILESYAATSESRYFTNAVTEMVLQQGAICQHVKVQEDNRHSLHIATTHVLQDRDSSYSSLSLTTGAELSRDNLRVTLDGAGGDCTLNGLYLIDQNQHCDHHTTIDHAKPHGTSRELYKGILNGKSRAVFNGKIIVRKDAQKTDAEQTNRNLLLSQASRINTTPQLEILADDVKCRHGATIGHLDDDALFYLRSRGIKEEVARTMLMKGFIEDVTGRLPEGKVRSLVDELVMARLTQFTGANL